MVFLWDEWVGRTPPKLSIDSLQDNIRIIQDTNQLGRISDTFLNSHWADTLRKHSPLPGVCFPLTGWIGSTRINRFYRFYASCNFDDPHTFSLIVHEGAYDLANENIVDTDAWLEIHTDSQSIKMAILDVKHDDIALHNRDNMDLSHKLYFKPLADD